MAARFASLFAALLLAAAPFAACSLASSLDDLKGSPDGGAGSGGGSGDGGIGTAPDGALCKSSDDCKSGHCVGGVCCSSECSGPCQGCTAALKGGGVDGECGPIKEGTDPADSCQDEGIASCGNDGRCDGKGGCRKYAAGSECAAQTCQNGVKTLARTCDGAGACQAGGTVTCVPASCNGVVCTGDCASDVDCQAGQYCDLASGDCLTKKATGEACQTTKPNQCASGFCVDDVCCDSGCTGACQACSSVKKGSGVNGACANVGAGLDPDDDCADQGATSCGNDGTCNGSGACRKYASGTPCGPSQCTGSTQTNASSCNGSGSCISGSTQTCSPYVCKGAVCGSACISNADCVSPNTCLNGQCGGKKGNGSSCASDTECVSGFCVDGVCCSSACSGVCQACSNAKTGGTNGTCSNLPSGQDPDAECASTPASSCGTSGSCNGNGACALHGAGTVCAAASCNGTTLSLADTCNGSGSCVNNGSVDCTPYICSGSACKTSCFGLSDCAPGYSCTGGACAVSKKADGQPCGNANECQSGYCVDSVCCSSACTGLCRRCDGLGTFTQKGTCGVIECTDPDNECAGTSFCGGGGSCFNICP